VKDENGDLIADSHNILNGFKNYFSQLLNVHNVSDVRQIEVHTSEPLVPGPSHLEVEIAFEKKKKYKSPGNDQIPVELIQAVSEILLSGIHKLVDSVWNKEELPYQWKEFIIVPVHKKGDKTDCNNYRWISLLSTSLKILSNIFLSKLSPYIDEIIGDNQCGFRRNRSTTNQKTYDSVRREVMYIILIKCGVTMKPVRFVKVCLNETCSKVRIGKHLSDSFSIQNGLKQGYFFITTAFQLCSRICQ
jgi:hypothetical protein